MNSEEILVLGDGVAANLFIYQLLLQNPSQRITQISASQFVAPVSLHSTATVALRGISPGISPLGDLLHHSYQTARRFFVGNTWLKGVEKSSHIECWRETYEKREEKERRYPKFCQRDEEFLAKGLQGMEEEVFIIHPSDYLLSIKKRNKELGSHYKYVEDFIVKVEKKEAIGLQGPYPFEKIVVAAGAYEKQLGLEGPVVEKSKVVRGSYLEFDFNYPRSLSITFQGINLVYRKSDKKLLVGSTTLEGAIQGEEFLWLKSAYEQIRESLNLELPSIEKSRFVSGLRLKGWRRMPFWGECRKNVNLISGLYKNGYSLSILAGEQLSKSLMIEEVRS